MVTCRELFNFSLSQFLVFKMGIKIVHTSKADRVLYEIMHVKGLAQASAWGAGKGK